MKKFKKEDKFYFWYRVKKEAQIIEKQVNIKESLNFLEEESDKIGEVNNKILFVLVIAPNSNYMTWADEIKKHSVVPTHVYRHKIDNIYNTYTS